MDIIIGRPYILYNIYKGGFRGCSDLVKITGQKVIVYDINKYGERIPPSIYIRDKYGDTHVCESINLKSISINRRIE